MGPGLRRDDGECLSTLRANFSFQISDSQALSSSRRRASWIFSFSPLDFEGRRSAERRALAVTKAPFGRSVAGFVAKGPFFRGLGCLAARRSPAAACPRPANFSGSAPYWARTATPQPPSLCLRGTAADTASDRLGLPRPGQAFALSHFSNASRSAPHWTGHGQDKGGFGDGDKEYEKNFSSAFTGTCPGRGAACRSAEAARQ